MVGRGPRTHARGRVAGCSHARPPGAVKSSASEARIRQLASNSPDPRLPELPPAGPVATGAAEGPRCRASWTRRASRPSRPAHSSTSLTRTSSFPVTVAAAGPSQPGCLAGMDRLSDRRQRTIQATRRNAPVRSRRRSHHLDSVRTSRRAAAVNRDPSLGTYQQGPKTLGRAPNFASTACTTPGQHDR